MKDPEFPWTTHLTLGEHAAHLGEESESSFSAMRQGEYWIRRLKMEAEFLADYPHDL